MPNKIFKKLFVLFPHNKTYFLYVCVWNLLPRQAVMAFCSVHWFRVTELTGRRQNPSTVATTDDGFWSDPTTTPSHIPLNGSEHSRQEKGWLVYGRYHWLRRRADSHDWRWIRLNYSNAREDFSLHCNLCFMGSKCDKWTKKGPALMAKQITRVWFYLFG